MRTDYNLYRFISVFYMVNYVSDDHETSAMCILTCNIVTWGWKNPGKKAESATQKVETLCGGVLLEHFILWFLKCKEILLPEKIYLKIYFFTSKKPESRVSLVIHTFIALYFALPSSNASLTHTSLGPSHVPTHSPPPSTTPLSAIPSAVLALLLWPSDIASPEWFIVLPGCSQHFGPCSSPPSFPDEWSM